jgi:hypothetical protein
MYEPTAHVFSAVHFMSRISCGSNSPFIYLRYAVNRKCGIPMNAMEGFMLCGGILAFGRHHRFYLGKRSAAVAACILHLDTTV